MRHGRYPGGPSKWGIHSEKVLTGGVGCEGAEALKGGRKGDGGGVGRRVSGRARERSRIRTGESRRGSRSRSRRSSRSRGGQGHGPADEYTDAQMMEVQNISKVGSQVSRTSRHF